MKVATFGTGGLPPRFEAVRRIAVLRGGGLGDVLFAIPAMEALAATYPEADITLLGTPLHAALFENRPGPVCRVEVLPFAAGVRPGPEDPGERAGFLRRMRTKRFDLAVQLHGGGRHSNPFLLQLGARHTVGTATPDATPLERTLPYLYYQHEVLRALEVVGLVGAGAVTLTPRVGLTAADQVEAAPLLRESTGNHPLLALHPGATDPRRRWPVEQFAMVARWAAEDGFDVLVVGDESDRDLAAAVVGLARGHALGQRAREARNEPAAAWGPDPGRRLHEVPMQGDGPGGIRSVAGDVGLPGLVGLLAASDVFVGNDSGPRHLAQAVGTATVGIYWIGNAMMAAALGRADHRLHLGWVTHCPECGSDVTQLGWTTGDCGHNFPLTSSVRPQDVYADVLSLLELRRASRAEKDH